MISGYWQFSNISKRLIFYGTDVIPKVKSYFKGKEYRQQIDFELKE